MKLQIHNNHVYPDIQAKSGGADTMVTFHHHHPPTKILFWFQICTNKHFYSGVVELILPQLIDIIYFV